MSIFSFYNENEDDWNEKYFQFIYVYLEKDVQYQIGLGDDNDVDNYLILLNLNNDLLDYNDDNDENIDSVSVNSYIIYTPNESNFYKIGAGYYSGIKSNITIHIYPSPKCYINYKILPGIINVTDKTFVFYSLQGLQSKQIKYSTVGNVSNVLFSIESGNLPQGVTFNTSTGTFSSDGTQTVDSTTILKINIHSSDFKVSTVINVTLIIDTVNNGSNKFLIIDAGVDGYLELTLNNSELICGASNYNDPGTHSDLRKNYPHVYFGHRACWIGVDENNLEEWNIASNNHYELSFNVNEIESIELIYCGRNIKQTAENKYSNSNDSLTLNDNTIIIIDNDGSSAEYKFKITFN